MVSGKGGVGKTAVAAALALLEARRGLKVLLVEFGERSFFRHIFPSAGTTEPTLVTDGLWVVRWDPESCLREYLHHYLMVDRLVDLFFDNRVTQALLGAAPGLNELSLMGKLTSGPRGIGPDLPFDVIVADCYATGHFQALLMAPVGMAEAIPFGPMGQQSRLITEVVKRETLTQTVLVTLPEELPMNETDELRQFLQKNFGLKPTVVINRNFEIPLSQDEIDKAQERIKVMQNRSSWVEDFCAYLSQQGLRQEEAKSRVHSWGLEEISLPFHFSRHWPELIRLLSQDLESRWPRG